MGGKVQVSSEYGKGSTFSIELIAMCKVPNNNNELEEAQFIIPKALPYIEPSKFDNKPRILLVNDDPFLLYGY